MDDPIITIGDIRKAGYCAAGARQWFGHHGLDFKAFLKNGVPASVMLATGDSMAEKVVDRVRKRHSHG